MSVEVNPATQDHWPDIAVRIQQSYWGKWQSVSQIRSALQNSMAFVALIDGQFAGFVRVTGDGHIFSSITDLWVDRKYRDMGVGRAMMRHIVEQTWVKRTICILASRDAKGFYEKFGFFRIGGDVMQRNPAWANVP